MSPMPLASRSIWRVVALGVVLAASAALADDDHGPRREVQVQALGGDRFVAGGDLSVDSAVEGDLLVTGGSVEVDAAVAGDVLALGGQLRLNGDVGGSVVGAAGQTTVDGKVGRNLRLAGGRVEIGPRAEVAGNVSVGAGRLRLRGHVRGQVLAGGGQVLIDGPVDGDVVVGGGEVALGPNARIGGQLRYRSGRPLEQDPAAQVAGGIERLAPLGDHEDRAESRREAGEGAVALAGLLWTLGLIALAGLWVGLLPDLGRAVARSLRERPGASLLLGFALLLCVPAAAVLLFATLIGVPIGLVLLALYGALLPLAYVGGALGLGEWALRRWRPQRADRPLPRFAAAAGVLLALSLLGLVPVLGPLLGLAVLLSGLGALALQWQRRPSVAA